MAAQSQKDGGRHVELEVIEAETTAMVEMVANQRAPGKGGQHQLSVVGKHDDQQNPTDNNGNQWAGVSSQAKVSTDSNSATKQQTAGMSHDTTNTKQ